MRLLFIAEKYPPIVGGGETHLEQLATGLVAAGHEVTVATDRLQLSDHPFREGVRLVDVPGLADACATLRCHRAMESLHRLVTTEGADVVHIINHVPALLLSWLRPAIRARLAFSAFETLITNERVFSLFNDFDLEATLQQSLVDGLRPDVVICGSQAYKLWARAAGFDEKILRVIPHATDIQRFAFMPEARAAFRQERNWSSDEFVFLVPARPVPRKRIENVLSSAAALASHYRLRVVLTAPRDRGNLEYARQLDAQIRHSCIESCVSWERDLEWSDMPIVYSASDAVVLPSAHEGFGIALLEAMAASRPVIATNIEGPNEIVKHGVTGFIYSAGDIDALTSAMVRVMSEDTSAMVERARHWVQEEFSHSIMVQRHAEVYADTMRARAI